MKGQPSRALLSAFLLLIGVLLAVGCGRTNELPQYMPKVQSAFVVTFTNNSPAVYIGSDNSDTVMGTFNDVAALGSSFEAQEKLERAVDARSVSSAMTDTFKTRLNESFGTNIVATADAGPDSRIEVTVVDYGLEAANMTSPVYFFYDVDVRMVYMPENKLIWEYDTTIHEPLNDQHVPLGIIGTSMNLKELSDLEDDQIALVFNEMAHVAGDVLVAQMLRDSTKD